MYWRAIGTSVKEVYRHTYAYNTLYTRPIYPLGQTYGGVPKRDVVRFRQLAVSYGARGLSWWSWQATPSSAWSGLAAPLDAYPAATPKPGLPATLKRGARGDLVVWAQQHLLSAGKRVPVNGVLDLRTRSAVRAVQRAKGLPVTGALDPATWRVLLANPPAKVRWRRGGATPTTRKPPRSATAPAKRNELRAKPGP
jgi:hypothetical protein